MTFRVGILMPRSTLYPSLGLDILNGIKQNLKLWKIFDKVKFISDNIGFGTDEQEVYSKAERMLLQEEIDVIILIADVRMIELLGPLFAASNKILLAVNFGANFPDSWQPAATTITHSLNFSFHTRLTGMLAAEETNKQVANVISYYDGGYRQCYTMLNANQVNGGIPKINHVTHLRLNEFTLAPLEDFFEQNREVTTLLCLFAGDQAERFYKEIAPLQKKFNLILYVSPMMFEDALKNNLGNKFSIENVKGYIPWHKSLINESNNIFKEIIKSETGKQVNYFLLLGWETGELLNQIFLEYNQQHKNAASIINTLSGLSLKSPRGWLKIDPVTNQTFGPSFLAFCKKNFEISIKEEKANVEEEWNLFTKETLLPGESSSWKNTYLCI